MVWATCYFMYKDTKNNWKNQIFQVFFWLFRRYLLTLLSKGKTKVDNTEMTSSKSGSYTPEKPYETCSAQELGELMNTSPQAFLWLDMGVQTRWFDTAFIEDILRCVERDTDINMLKELIMVKWRRCVGERCQEVCRFDEDLRQWKPKNNHFIDDLEQVVERVMAYRKDKVDEERMIQKWKRVYYSSTDDVKYRLCDLPDDVRTLMMITDDYLFSEFVELIKGPVNDWIGTHYLRDWNVVRFICRLRGIFARRCSMPAFAKFLMSIGFADYRNNMKQRKDANDDSNFRDYDNINKRPYILKLRMDGEQVEDILKPIINKMIQVADNQDGNQNSNR